jgi:hypothetical protein
MNREQRFKLTNVFPGRNEFVRYALEFADMLVYIFGTFWDGGRGHIAFG